MDFGALLLALAVIVLVVAFVARPFMERATQSTQLAATNDLVTQREAILTELRELDFDHTTGKVAEDDYHNQRTRLVAKGAEILKALDQLQPTTYELPAPEDVDDEIEQLIAARRAGATAIRSSAKSAATTSQSQSCPQCHKPVRATDKFCPSCGAKLV